MLLALVFRQLLRHGQLGVITADGRHHRFGPGHQPSVTIRLHNRGVERRLALNPGLALGEAYMSGALTLESGSLYEFLELLMANQDSLPPGWCNWLIEGTRFGRRLQQLNPISRARRNVAHHYDLSDELYQLFLDSDRQYSCGYFLDPTDSLETAQNNKKRHIAAKLLLQPGQHVLDIGSGWGGLALSLARDAGVEVTGLTLSVEQQRYATARAKAEGLEDRVRFHLRDYREETGRYDRIVSVGMFEHVGIGHYPAFFRKINQCLREDGVALVHAIGRRDGPGVTNAWIRKYIFPGGYTPALSEVLPVIERNRFWVGDIEILRLHYALTLRHWRLRFQAQRDAAIAKFDAPFYRMWEFYLAGSEAAFRVQSLMVFQIQLAKRVDTIPLTRDYIGDWEQAADAILAMPA